MPAERFRSKIAWKLAQLHSMEMPLGPHGGRPSLWPTLEKIVALVESKQVKIPLLKRSLLLLLLLSLVVVPVPVPEVVSAADPGSQFRGRSRCRWA